ncbi:MAG: hypothetical protein WC052_03660 [Patescibacteria group bacterium]|jgi:hypothetical protein
MSKPSLLLLTNLYNESLEEDIYLSQKLRKYFNVSLAHPLDSEKLEKKVDAVIVRNIWPTFEYKAQKTNIIRRLIKRGHIPATSAEKGYLAQSRYLEKDYLLDLFTQGYPVIPSIDRLSELTKLGDVSAYYIKPKNKCDGIGAKKLSRPQLLRQRLKNYIIQPYISFEYEICFYFIDNKFVYAFSTPNRLEGKNYKLYRPSKRDLNFALKFVRWNKMPFGLQRVDAVRVKNSGELLLTELEDFGPYLYLLEMPEHVRSKIIKALVKSIVSQNESDPV